MTSTNQHIGRQTNSRRATLLALITICAGYDLSWCSQSLCCAFVIPSETATMTCQRQYPSTSTTISKLMSRDIADETEMITMSVKPAKVSPRQAVVVRRPILSVCANAFASAIFSAPVLPLCPPPANADFAPGGTLLDREVSITYGNLEASPTRARDNSNVIFPQDNYYKFGAAARWILPPGSTDYPLTIPFVPSQRRYDALKKYGPKVKQAVDAIVRIGSSSTTADNVPERTDPSYQLRSLGLIADSFLASDNTGTTNELMLARWYINEMYLRIGDYRDALVRGDAKEAKGCYDCLTKAMNSYLSLLNRSITIKVGDQFGYII